MFYFNHGHLPLCRFWMSAHSGEHGTLRIPSDVCPQPHWKRNVFSLFHGTLSDTCFIINSSVIQRGNLSGLWNIRSVHLYVHLLSLTWFVWLLLADSPSSVKLCSGSCCSQVDGLAVPDPFSVLSFDLLLGCLLEQSVCPSAFSSRKEKIEVPLPGGEKNKFFPWDNFPPDQRVERTLSRKVFEGIIHSEFAFLLLFKKIQQPLIFHNRSRWIFVLEMAAEFLCDKGKLMTPAALWPCGEEGPATGV